MAKTNPDNIALEIDSLHKDFALPHERKNSIKEHVMSFRRKTTYERFHVLKNIDFKVKKGEFFGIVGRNGSGKSTLLKIMGGIYQPSKGSVKVNGTLTPFIELGIGFNPELTGKQNIFLNGAILGLTHKEIIDKYDEIVAFAELEKFMDQKLKNYSSGMQVRLAFSIAIQAHNDILLIDEVLAVGDASFQRKCYQTFKGIKQSNKTVIFVSHDMAAIREYCDRAILIEKGEIISSGDPDKVSADYLKLFTNLDTTVSEKNNRWGSGEMKISKISIKQTPSRIVVRCKVKTHKTVTNPIAGLIIKDLDKHHIIESNNKWKNIQSGTFKSQQTPTFVWEIPNVFKTGSYTATIALASEDGLTYFDWWEDAVSFDVTRLQPSAGLVQVDDTFRVA